MEWYEKDSVRALRDKWYAKLNKSGFRDIEIIDKATGEHGPLMHGPSTGDLRRGLYKPATEEYYRCARKHLWDMRARAYCPEDRLRIWALHSEGVSQTKIHEQTGAPMGRIRKVVASELKRMKESWDYELDRSEGVKW